MAAVCSLMSCSRMMPRPCAVQAAHQQREFGLAASASPSPRPTDRRRRPQCGARPARSAAGRVGKSRKAEEGHARRAGRGAIGRLVVGRKAMVDIGAGLGVGQAALGDLRDATSYGGRPCRRRRSPAARGRAPPAALRPIRKKVARTHSCSRASSTCGVVLGEGPSSKVSTTS